MKSPVSETAMPVSTDKVADFVAMVGNQIRLTRKKSAISRRILSEKSGVSQRYLAQLEAGSGNISIALLFQIATALETNVQDLLIDTDVPQGDFQRFANLFHNATGDQKNRALEQLQQSVNSGTKDNRICLLGLRGAGKSTLGQRLAEQIDTEFLELNRLIEDQGGMPIGDLIALYGQEGFRQLEKRALDTVLRTKQSVVLAVGGGIVSEAGTYQLLLESFHTIWLKALPEEHMERVRQQGDNRPMAGNPKAMDELRSILVDREGLYSRADALVDTSNRSPDSSLQDLLDEVAQILSR